MTSSTTSLEALADTLWAERHVVEFLLFKLVSARLLLAANEARFVPAAVEEVDRAVGALKAAELRRETALQGVANDWGVPIDALTLETLASRAPVPFDTLFKEHQKAFLTLADEVEQTARQNSELASAALSHVQESLVALGGGSGPAPTYYDAAGRRTNTGVHRSNLDEVL